MSLEGDSRSSGTVPGSFPLSPCLGLLSKLLGNEIEPTEIRCNDNLFAKQDIVRTTHIQNIASLGWIHSPQARHRIQHRQMLAGGADP